MVDRVIRWFVDGTQSSIKKDVGGTYLLDDDYYPEWVHLSLRKAGKGESRALKLDITDDGTSIFNDKPALANNQSEKIWTTIPRQVMRDQSVLRLNRDQTFDLLAGEDLTVELGLTKS